jgi:hypothetical protein
MTAIKIICDGQIRRFRLTNGSIDVTFNDLHKIIYLNYVKSSTTGYVLNFQDDENDMCVISHPRELAEAIRFANNKTLKLYFSQSTQQGTSTIDSPWVKIPSPNPKDTNDLGKKVEDFAKGDDTVSKHAIDSSKSQKAEQTVDCGSCKIQKAEETVDSGSGKTQKAEKYQKAEEPVDSAKSQKVEKTIDSGKTTSGPVPEKSNNWECVKCKKAATGKHFLCRSCIPSCLICEACRPTSSCATFIEVTLIRPKSEDVVKAQPIVAAPASAIEAVKSVDPKSKVTEKAKTSEMENGKCDGCSKILGHTYYSCMMCEPSYLYCEACHPTKSCKSPEHKVAQLIDSFIKKKMPVPTSVPVPVPTPVSTPTTAVDGKVKAQGLPQPSKKEDVDGKKTVDALSMLAAAGKLCDYCKEPMLFSYKCDVCPQKLQYDLCQKCNIKTSCLPLGHSFIQYLHGPVGFPMPAGPTSQNGGGNGNPGKPTGNGNSQIPAGGTTVVGNRTKGGGGDEPQKMAVETQRKDKTAKNDDDDGHDDVPALELSQPKIEIHSANERTAELEAIRAMGFEPSIVRDSAIYQLLDEAHNRQNNISYVVEKLLGNHAT